MRGEAGEGAQVQPSIAEGGRQRRVFTRGTRGGDAQVRLGLGEAQPQGAVDEHRGAALARVEAPGVDLGEMEDEIDLGGARARHDRRGTVEENVVGQGGERRSWLVGDPSHRDGTGLRSGEVLVKHE